MMRRTYNIIIVGTNISSLSPARFLPQQNPDSIIQLTEKQKLAGSHRHPERLEMDKNALVDHTLKDITQLLPPSREPIYF
jgi:L-2-hydroxyglutarate oxidase LhgO